ncbi:MAG: YqiJ family protein [Hyphomicrobiaceae bacterium]
MFDALLAPALAPFTVALGVMFLIALAEVLGTILGLSPAGLVDQLVPHADVDADADVSLGNDSVDASGGWMSGLLGWLCVGRVPVLVLFVALLTCFGLAGFVVQSSARSLVGGHLPALVAVVPALMLALPPTRWLALGLARLIPKEETDAVSTRTFIGRVATITRGVASPGTPAEARLRDATGHTHYVLVEPDEPDARFEQGTEVLITSQTSASRFKAIRSTNAFLTH